MVVSPFPHLHRRDVPDIDPVHRPEVWGGVEPTFNRVGDSYLDQLTRSGHITRIEDLDLFADLGIKAIRYPVLWEKISPGHIDDADWAWPDARLSRLRQLGVRPIVGLVHHGSGPLHTSLLDPEFPEKLATYAGAVARRYPWIDDYTPVNEPLTTARFSTLYGHWYPHDRSDSSFARAVIGQCRAVVLAMQAIREVNPGARLIQTEELGMVHSTPELAYQAEFENERRWLTYDLLSGQLTPERRLWTWLQESGIPRHELQWFLDNPCPPDVLGVNYYLTSERFLDHMVDNYPGESIGSNGVDSYVDVCAARVLPDPINGVETLLHQAWDRYGIPIAVTEVHNGSTPEEQLRWLHEVWLHAVGARRSGVDVQAITVWALLGTYDWASLVTQDSGVYEPGVFDLRGPEPRPTALARMTRDLAVDGAHDHPVIDVPGWWRRPDRHPGWSPPTSPVECLRARNSGDDFTGVRNILVIAGDPALASAITAACEFRHIPATVVDGSSVDDIKDGLNEGGIWAMILAFIDGTDYGEPVSLQTFTELSCQKGIPYVTFTSAPLVTGAESRPGAGCPQELAIVVNSTEPDESATGPVFDNLAHVALDLLIDDERGRWSLATSDDGSWQAVAVSYAGTHGHREVAAPRLSSD